MPEFEEEKRRSRKGEGVMEREKFILFWVKYLLFYNKLVIVLH